MFNRMLVADFKVGTCRGEIWKAFERRPGVIWVNSNGISLQFPQPRQFYQGNLAVQKYGPDSPLGSRRIRGSAEDVCQKTGADWRSKELDVFNE